MTAPLPPPRKHLGQNFLIDPNIVRKIVSAAALAPTDTVLEIGPGRGALTRQLCEQAASVVAVEIDPLLARHLRESLADCPTLTLHEADALSWSFEQVPVGTVVLANLPYYISTELLFRILEAGERFSRAVVMLQAEVAQRLVAQPGTKDYGILSVLTQLTAEPRILFRVSAECFRPRPDVASSVVSLTMRPIPTGDRRQAEIPARATIAALVRAAFAHRRKTLVNSLRDAGYGVEGAVVLDALRRIGLDANVRAETLSVAQFVDLAGWLFPPAAS
ncbi:MAG: 16S rRNA (adenine(1518)-N(6)/adenine(1519)-N(6))-dimethyltransferase RsmA [Nitrospiraceae bacterium]